ncbi:MAG TPA: hypothetical protein VMR97_13620 [Acidimicrobiales bacterium]|nr:hypothetical protein [Acidimicrobiales bacterium]
MRRLLIRYVSHGFPTGYGEAGRRLVHALTREGVSIQWLPIQFKADAPLLPSGYRSRMPDLEPLRSTPGSPDLVVVHSVPEVLPYMARIHPRGVPLVAHTVWEADELQSHWCALLNSCDAVVVPTAWNADSFRRAGVDVPVVVVPHVASIDEADPDAYTWLGPRGIDAGKSFVVHSIATWTSRKAPWLAVEAYARAFGPEDDTLLVLRTDALADRGVATPPGPEARRSQTSWSVAHILHRNAPTGRVRLVCEHRSRAELVALHRRSDCWLSLPHAEGWCLGSFDAAATGTPVVTTGHGGPLAYLDRDVAHLVPSHPMAAPGLDGVTWAAPDMDAAVEALRHVRRDPRGARKAAAVAGEGLRRLFAPEVVARRFIDSLEEVGVI